MLRDRRTQILAATLLVTLLIWAFALFQPRNTLQVTFLDVGDGLCVVARTPSGKTIVVDCGTSSWRDSEMVGQKLTAPYLQSLGVNTIDVAILTHPHSDHLSGYEGLLKVIPARLVIDSKTHHGSPTYSRFLKQVKKCGAEYRNAKRGQVVDMNDGVRLEILHPQANAEYEELNNYSVVAKVIYNQIAILLTGDAQEEAEQEVMESGINPRAQVLQVGHHGGKEATSLAWLRAVSPDVAVISCARNSRYGFPAPATVSRLESEGIRSYQTGRDGAIQITSDGTNIRVHTFRRRQ